MRQLTVRTITGVLLDEQLEFTLDQVCQVTGVQARVVAHLVDEGLLEPKGESATHWRFPATALVHLARARRLQEDLGVNVAGIALALDLLDEVRALRTRVANLEAMLAAASGDE